MKINSPRGRFPGCLVLYPLVFIFVAVVYPIYLSPDIAA